MLAAPRSDRPETSKVTRAMNSSTPPRTREVQESAQMLLSEAALEEAVCSNPNLKEFKDAEALSQRWLPTSSTSRAPSRKILAAPLISRWSRLTKMHVTVGQMMVCASPLLD